MEGLCYLPNVFDLNYSHQLFNSLVEENSRLDLFVKCPFRKGSNSSKSLMCPSYQNRSRIVNTICSAALSYLEILGLNLQVLDVFGNYYLEGSSLPLHKDRYGQGVHVMSISFGATRRFYFTETYRGCQVKAFNLESGSIFLFSDEVNSNYYHGIRKQNAGERINLTCFVKIKQNSEVKKFEDLNKVQDCFITKEWLQQDSFEEEIFSLEKSLTNLSICEEN